MLTFKVLRHGAVFIAFILIVSCTSSSGKLVLPAKSVDTEKPTILEILPSTEDQIETDVSFRILFSELMDEASLVGAVSVYEENRTDFDPEILRQIDVDLSFSEVLVEDEDELTGEPEERKATLLSITPRNRDLALSQSVLIDIGDTAKDRSEVENNHPVTGDLVNGNFLGSSNRTFETLSGDWEDEASEIDLDIQGDIYSLKSFSRPDGQPGFLWAEPGVGADTLNIGLYDGGVNEWRFFELPVPADALGGIFNPAVETSRTGEIVLTWEQQSMSAGATAVYINFFDDDSWMAESQKVSVNETFPAFQPSIARFANGRYLLFWTEESLAGYAVMYVTFDPYEAEEPFGEISTLVSQLSETIVSLTVAGYDSGALIAWISQEGTEPSYVKASLIRRNGSSVEIGRVSGEFYAAGKPAGNVESLSAILDSSGSGYIVWSQQNSGRRDVYRAVFSNETVQDVELAEFDNSGEAYNPSIYVDGYGGAHMLWLMEGNLSRSILSSALARDAEVGGGDERFWQAPVELGTQRGVIDTLVGRYDTQNNFHAVWAKGDISSRLETARYDYKTKEWSSKKDVGIQSGRSRATLLEEVNEDGRMVLIQSNLLDSGYFGASYTLYSQIDNL